jgi:DNA invertase Pin-like site-specific DNA recombinase
LRVSSAGQNDARQLAGIELDKVFTDTASGKSVDRPELERMFEFLREGDTLIVHSMDRLARNLSDLLRMVKDLTSDGVKVQFFKENLTFTGDESPMATLLLSVMGAVAEFERAIIAERRREGIAVAKQNGVYRGRKPSLTQRQAADLRVRATAENVNKANLAREFGISRATLYVYLSQEA